MKTKLITAAAVLIVLIGFGILLYPVVSNMIFQKGQEELITYYENQIKEIPAEEINTMLNDCRKYNQELLTSKVKLTDPFDDKLRRRCSCKRYRSSSWNKPSGRRKRFSQRSLGSYRYCRQRVFHEP